MTNSRLIGVVIGFKLIKRNTKSGARIDKVVCQIASRIIGFLAVAFVARSLVDRVCCTKSLIRLKVSYKI